MAFVNYYFVNFNKSPFVLKQVIVQNCRLLTSERVYCYRLQKISLCVRRRENGEGVLRLWVTAARELSVNRSRGERKDAGGADFVPLPLNAPLYICSVQVRFGIYLSELSGKPKYFYGKWSII